LRSKAEWIVQLPGQAASVRLLYQLPHGFWRRGTIFVAELIMSDIAHHGDLSAWSLSTLLQSMYGNRLVVERQ
jgi:putative copper resistance protein D